MKKLNLSSFVLLLFTFVLTSFQSVLAQKARIQWIHNSASINTDTVDIYLNGNRVADDLRFLFASPLDSISVGVYTVNINEASSIDSGDLVIARLTLTITGGNNTVMICGVDSAVNYAANPNGRNTSLKLVQRKGVLLFTSSANSAAVSLYHGVTDNEGITIGSRPVGITANKMKFGDTTANFTPSSVATVIDVKDTTGNTIIKSFALPLNLYGKKSVSVFASGFMNPAANQNGAAFNMYYTDTLGGAAKKMDEVSRVQFINNSPDVILDTVDIWLNNTKLISKLGFRKATATTTVISGTYDITITKKNSPDTTGTNVVYRIPAYNFTTGKTYIGMISGVVDIASYAVNPDAANRNFMLNMYDNYTESNAASGAVLTYYFNGVPDAASRGFNRNPTAPISVFSDAVYNAAPTTASIPTTSVQIMQESSAGIIQRAYRLNLSGQGGKVGVLFLSGFIDSTGNKTGASSKMYGAWLAYSDGSMIGLTSLNSYLQLIHTSDDPTIASVKVFLNGKSIADSFNYRTATPFIELFAYKPYRIHLTASGSTDTSAAFYNLNILPDSGKYQYAVAAGYVTPTGVNPDGVSKNFALILNPNAKKTAGFNSKNVDLMYFHSIADAPATTARGFGQPLYLSKGDKYKSFHGYNPHSAFDDVQFSLRNAYNDTPIYHTCYGQFSAHKGLAGLVYSSGSLGANNLMMFVAWPNGQTDTLTPDYTGLSEQKNLIQGFSIYPIPASDQLTIKPGLVKGTIDFHLLDINGRVLSEFSLAADGNNTPITIPVNTLENGLYFIEATNSFGAKSVQKIIIGR